MKDTDLLKKIVEDAENVVFFGGAGVSTASGIPDFRGNGGMYTVEAEDGDVAPEVKLSRGYLLSEPEKFFDNFRKNMLYPYAEPNGAHIALAELEKRGKLSAVITQNIDGLHQLAGSDNVLEVHGTLQKNYCMRCKKSYSLLKITENEGVPRCDDCGGLVRPDIVLYGEPLNGEVFGAAQDAIYDADVLIVAGTSLTVNPAASLVSLYNGEHLIIINKSETPYDALAELVIREPVEQVLSALTAE